MSNVAPLSETCNKEKDKNKKQALGGIQIHNLLIAKHVLYHCAELHQ